MMHENIRKPYKDYIIPSKTGYQYEDELKEMVRVINGKDAVDVTEKFLFISLNFIIT